MRRTGLCYDVLFEMLDRRGLTGEAWDQMFADIQTMERAAIKAAIEAS